ncbi:MAG: hypothetical protein Q8K34_14540, partial [Hydrogenophaga sp.]|nr:hypothetical protein [Hydrogenophaga sp.]
KPQIQKNFSSFPPHNQRIKKKIAKEIKKDLESPKRVLLLHPHSERRSRENCSLKKSEKRFGRRAKRVLSLPSASDKTEIERVKKENEIFFSKSLPNQKEVVLLHPL